MIVPRLAGTRHELVSANRKCAGAEPDLLDVDQVTRDIADGPEKVFSRRAHVKCRARHSAIAMMRFRGVFGGRDGSNAR